ncbi:hypothetical protein B6K85_04215 [Vibrio sp. V1B]|uniref:hypothetical protein n=1 Tax=Vibrio harveyi group TaxID=717610 RepID=UPI0003A6C146|nr:MULTISPECIES: hypothetical protein [Vibrio harveyi group]PAW11671.1 hypothetical protein B6K85_04215 [Vibrio sp. V1B]
MKWMSVLSIITLSSALSGCGGSDSSDPEVAVRALNFQTVNFVNQNPSGVSDIGVQANYGSLQEDIYSNLPLYGATETGLLLIQENASTFDITFDLIETNSQQTLVSETRSIAVSNPQVIFAFGDANTGFYDLVFQDKPDTSSTTNTQVSVFVMDASQLQGGINSDVWVDGSQRIFNLSKRTLSSQIIVGANTANVPIEIRETGTTTVIDTCNVSTETRAIMVIFDPLGNCRVLSVLDPVF